MMKTNRKKVKKIIFGCDVTVTSSPPILDRPKVLINRAKFHFRGPSSFGAPEVHTQTHTQTEDCFIV